MNFRWIIQDEKRPHFSRAILAMIQKVIVSVVVILFVNSQVARTGVRDLGNGGGFAEMKALRLIDHLPAILKLCESPPSICRLNPEELESLQQLLKKTPLSFSYTTDLNRVRFSKDGEISVSSHLLYATPTQAISTAAMIDLFIFTMKSAMMPSPGSGVTVPSADEGGIPKIVDLSEELRSHGLSNGVLVHEWSVFAAAKGFRKEFLIVETESKSFDFTKSFIEAVHQKIPQCWGDPEAAQFSLENLQLVHIEENQLENDSQGSASLPSGSLQSVVGGASRGLEILGDIQITCPQQRTKSEEKKAHAPQVYHGKVQLKVFKNESSLEALSTRIFGLF